LNLNKSLLPSLIALSTLLNTACVELPQSSDPSIITDLPTMRAVVDSLNRSGDQTLKWAITPENEVVFAEVTSVDWDKEFQAFLKENVNVKRFQDAYTIDDHWEADERHVSFRAKSERQEIQEVKYVVRSGKLVYYSVDKHRSNLLSEAVQHFVYDGLNYELFIDQEISGVFNNQQFIRGTIIPKGDVYRLLFDLGDDELPVLAVHQDRQLIVLNGIERVYFTQDDVNPNRFNSPHYNAYLEIDLNASEGIWVNAKRDETKTLPVRLDSPSVARFTSNIPEQLPNIAGEHRIVFFSPEVGAQDTGVMVLRQQHHQLDGSILTTTGDYRFLEGVISNDSILLSTMDGTHGYLFKGKIEGSSISGIFKAGTTWRQPWRVDLGVKHELADPEMLTHVRPDSVFNFRFMNTDKDYVSLTDERFQEKVVLLTVMGTWCSNCLDEIRFLNEVRSQYAAEELEIVALDFELISDSAQAWSNIERYKNSLNIQFPVLLAGLKTNSAVASQTLPALNQVISYPTLIILNRSHEIVKIHTGFSGPATGEAHYETFRRSYLELIERLVKA